MTSRKRNDYETVLKSILDTLPCCTVKEIVSDFEKALWRAVINCNEGPVVKIFKNVKHFGCVFHLNQAIFRRIQKLGLRKAYSRDRKLKELLD